MVHPLATISRSLATIRKGLTFEKILLTLPMGQYIGDFGNGLKGPNSSLFSDEFEFSKDVYYFDAKFKNMDLSSFSFYYEVRLLNQTESDEIPIVLGHFPLELLVIDLIDGLIMYCVLKVVRFYMCVY